MWDGGEIEICLVVVDLVVIARLIELEPRHQVLDGLAQTATEAERHKGRHGVEEVVHLGDPLILGRWRERSKIQFFLHF